MLFALGFVFMFTIGGLINNHLALPLSQSLLSALSPHTVIAGAPKGGDGALLRYQEEGFLDLTTICWELLTIMILVRQAALAAQPKSAEGRIAGSPLRRLEGASALSPLLLGGDYGSGTFSALIPLLRRGISRRGRSPRKASREPEFYLISVTKHNFELSAGNLGLIFSSKTPPLIPQRSLLGGIPLRRGFSNIIVGSSETIRSPRCLLREDLVQVRKNSWGGIFNSPLGVAILLGLQAGYGITRSYSNFSNKQPYNQDNIQNFKGVKVYDSMKEDRVNILKEQRDKSGVYCLINKVNGHAYVGSSINLASRMRNYLNKSFLKSKPNANMPITKALLKYDHSNFSLLILEYVEKFFLTARETFYITHMLPYYNVLKEGYSSLGYKHTEETKKLLSELAKNRTHSDKTKGLISRAVTGENNPFYNKSHSLESKIRMIEANSAYSVYIYNSFKELLVIFPSVLTLAKLIKSNHSTLVPIPPAKGGGLAGAELVPLSKGQDPSYPPLCVAGGLERELVNIIKEQIIFRGE